MAEVRLETVRKIYDNGFVAVHGASFEVADGEFVVLVGPSGCGKSTTLRMIAGLEQITDGDLFIGERHVNHVPPKDRDIAMVFQNYALYPHMSVYDNMAFGLRQRRYVKAEIKKRVEAAAETLGIASILDRRPKQLSGGQRQRVAVGRAIVRDPKVFLFDEPLSNLDAKLRVQMRSELAKLHRQLNATTIYVTHDQVEAMTMGDRIVLMRDGHIQQIDAPMDLYARPANRFVGEFIGSPAMNFIEGHVEPGPGAMRFVCEGAGLRLPLDAGADDAAEPRAVTLGVRPEDVSVLSGPRPPASHVPVDAAVELVEPMGNELFLHARVAEQTLIARVAPQPLPEPGERIPLGFDMAKLHFFARDTERALPLRCAAERPLPHVVESDRP